MKRARLIPVALAFVALFSAVPVQAFSEQFYSTNQIEFYDDRAVACVETASTVSSGVGGSSANQNKNAEIILRYLTGKGLTLAQATGFVGNMKQESSLNPAIIQGGAIAKPGYQPRDGVGFGLVQWTYKERQIPLVALVTAERPITDINLQLDNVWRELKGPYKSTLQALTSRPSISPTDAAIIVHGRTSKDPRLAIAPALGYEASGDTADEVVNVRGGNAEFYYKMFNGKIADGTGVVGGPSLQVDVVGGSCGTSITPTSGCPVTAPIYGEGGNRIQLKQADFEKLYGKGGPAVEPNLAPVDFMGKTVKVHKRVAPCLQAVVDDIKKANINYTIKQIGGYRNGGGAGQIENPADGYHYYGAALDINWTQNPYYEGGASRPYDMPKQYVDIFHAHGFSWGGNWRNIKDYMHFEFNGFEPNAGTK